MDYKTTLFTERRSVRAYTDKIVSEDNVHAILQAGIFAPSGMNLQGMRFMVLHGASDRREAFTKLHPRSRKVMDQAPVLVVVLQDTTRTYHVIKDAQSMGACMENMLLAATLLGLGSLWMGEAVDTQAAVLQALGLAEGAYVFHAVLCFGYAQKQPNITKRNVLDAYLLP